MAPRDAEHALRSACLRSSFLALRGRAGLPRVVAQQRRPGELLARNSRVAILVAER